MDKLIILLYSVMLSMPSYAYLGPGMGGGLIVAIIGFFVAILLGLWGVLYYPIKRALKERKDNKIALKESSGDPE